MCQPMTERLQYLSLPPLPYPCEWTENPCENILSPNAEASLSILFHKSQIF